MPSSVLIVEDHPEVRTVLHVGLRRNGYVVYETSSLQQAREVLKEVSIDAIILDLNLEGESAGVRTFYDLRNSVTNVPIIVVSGDDEAVEQLRGVASGVILKGNIDFHELGRIVEVSMVPEKIRKEFYEPLYAILEASMGINKEVQKMLDRGIKDIDEAPRPSKPESQDGGENPQTNGGT